MFEFYILEKGKTDFLSLPVDELNDLLKKFFVEGKDKSIYTKSSLTSIRFGLCRYIKSSRPKYKMYLCVLLPVLHLRYTYNKTLIAPSTNEYKIYCTLLGINLGIQ